MRFLSYRQFSISPDETVVCSAATTHDVHQSFVDEFAYLRCHRLRRLVVQAHRVRQSGIRISTDIIRRYPCQLLEIRLHLSGTERTVQSYGEYGIGRDAGQERLECLTAQGSSCQVANGGRKHDGQLPLMLLHHLDRSINGHLRIQGVKDCLDEYGVNTALHHGFHLFAIGGKQGIVSQLACCRITHVGTHRAGLGGRTDTAAYKAWLVGCGESISHLTGYARSLVSHLTGKWLHMVVGLADALTAERVRGNHVGTGHQVFPVDILDDVRTSKVQDIVVSFHLERRKRRNRLAQVFSPEIIFLKTVRLNHGTHGTIENQNPFLDTILY